MTNERLAGSRAIIAGGSIAGLLAARVLSAHFDEVILFESDELEEGTHERRRTPHSAHLHGILQKGALTLFELFPDLKQGLLKQGMIVSDFTYDLEWYFQGVRRPRFRSGIDWLTLSRPFLEAEIRKQVLGLRNVRLISGAGVRELCLDERREHVVGVQVEHFKDKSTQSNYSADFFVDAGGRGSKSPKWLESAGLTVATEKRIRIDLRYSAKLFRETPQDSAGPNGIFAYGQSKGDRDFYPGMLSQSCSWSRLEGGRVIATLFGHGEEQPPVDEAGYWRYAKSLERPEFYDRVTKLEPISDVYSYLFGSLFRRYYENLKDLPRNWIVLGDAVCGLSPMLGQGLSCAILEAKVLQEVLDKSGSALGSANISRSFFRSIKPLLDYFWTSNYLIYASQEERSVQFGLLNRYMSKVNTLSNTDQEVFDSVIRVASMSSDPSSLFAPKILGKVFRSWRTGRVAAQTAGGSQ